MKRVLDVVVAFTALVLNGWLILLRAAAAALAHGGSGFYVQRRVGRNCMTFPLLNLKTMRAGTAFETTVAPGITGPATLADRREEDMLAAQANPERYNREVMYRDKVRLNRAYVEDYTLWRDIGYLCRTLVGR